MEQISETGDYESDLQSTGSAHERHDSHRTDVSQHLEDTPINATAVHQRIINQGAPCTVDNHRDAGVHTNQETILGNESIQTETPSTVTKEEHGQIDI